MGAHLERVQRRLADVSDFTIGRLARYRSVLADVEEQGVAYLSSKELGQRIGATAPQVRKDLSIFGSFGKKGKGYPVRELGRELDTILGRDLSWKVGLIGAGNLGRALFYRYYKDFHKESIRIDAIYDKDPDKIGKAWRGVTIRDVAELGSSTAPKIDIAIVAVPDSEAPGVVKRLIDAGVRGILNFTRAETPEPEGVVIRDVRLVVEVDVIGCRLNMMRSQKSS